MPNPALNIEVLLEPVRLRRFLQQQRWFGAKARSIASVQLADVLDIGDLAWLTLIRVEFESGVDHEYLLPLAVVDATTAETLQRERPEAVVAVLDDARTLIDGVFDDGLCRALLDMLQNGKTCHSRAGPGFLIVAVSTATWRSIGSGGRRPTKATRRSCSARGPF